MTAMNRTDAACFFAERDRFCILTHRRPDGDTVGSAAALCLGLRSMGKEAHILENPELTDRFAYLHEGLTVTAPAEGDVLVSVDVAAPNMLPKAFEPYRDRIALRIDHHGTSTSFTELELVDPKAGACAEIIYDVLMELWLTLDEKMATAIYVATSTDTGCFRFANTTDHTFVVAAACAAAGAKIYELNQALFETISLSRLRMQGWMVENCKLFCDGRLAICPIPKAVEQELGVTEDDMDNISSFLRTIAGVRLAATLRETDGEAVKISVRGVPGYDAGAVCAKFGGGGHAGAAGGSIRLPLQEAAAALEQAMAEQENNR